MLRHLIRYFGRKTLSVLALPLLMTGTNHSLYGEFSIDDTSEDVLDEHINQIKQSTEGDADVQAVISLLDELRRARNSPGDDLARRANASLKTLDNLKLSPDERSHLRQKLGRLLARAGKLDTQTTTVPKPPPDSPTAQPPAQPAAQPQDPSQ